MKSRSFVIKLALAVLIFTAFAGAGFAGKGFRSGHCFKADRHSRIDGELLVTYKAASPYARKLSSIRAKRCERIGEFGRRGAVAVRLPRGMSVKEACSLYSSDPDVEAVQPNFRYVAASVPDDPSFPSQWGLVNSGQTIASPSYVLPDGSRIANPGTAGCDMNIAPVWDEITDARAVTVAVLDTGVNYTHEDLADNMWNGGTAYPNHGRDFTGSGSDDPIDRNGHGTMIAGIIGARGDNAAGCSGICRRASIMAVRVLDAAGNGSSASVVSGIDFAAANGAKVIILSLVTHEFDQAVYDAIKSAKERGVLVVAAAGNDAADTDAGSPAYPASYDLDNIISAAALDQNFALARFSNFGAAGVDIAAPGVNIVSAWGGTSSSIAETFSTGWTASDTNHPGTSGWGTTWESDPLYPDIKHWCLINPSFDEYYTNNIRDRVWRDYGAFAKSADAVTLSFTLNYSFYDAGDALGVYVKNAAGEPSPSDSAELGEIRGGTGGKICAYDLTAQMKGAEHFQVLYQLATDEAGSACSGVMISDMTVSAFRLSTSSYSNYSGTSAAAAHVAGLAAILFAFNPDYTYSDVVGAICAGGRTVSSLKAVTRTGCAADAEGALEYIRAPEGIGAELTAE